MRSTAPVLSTMFVLAPAVALAQPSPAPSGQPPPAYEVEQGRVGYASRGVRELGASAGMTLAQDIRAVNFSPAMGWFVSDSFELSAILDVANLKAGEGNSATIWSALFEPSFHFPFESGMFGFVGMGVGAAYVDELGAGVAVAPRLGMDFLVGRAGVLRPSLSYEYTTHDAMEGANADGTQDVTLVAISSALRFNIGYSSRW